LRYPTCPGGFFHPVTRRPWSPNGKTQPKKTAFFACLIRPWPQNTGLAQEKIPWFSREEVASPASAALLVRNVLGMTDADPFPLDKSPMPPMMADESDDARPPCGFL